MEDHTISKPTEMLGRWFYWGASPFVNGFIGVLFALMFLFNVEEASIRSYRVADSLQTLT